MVRHLRGPPKPVPILSEQRQGTEEKGFTCSSERSPPTLAKTQAGKGTAVPSPRISLLIIKDNFVPLVFFLYFHSFFHLHFFILLFLSVCLPA